MADELQKSWQNVLENYPRLTQHGIKVELGEGNGDAGYAEFYHPSESIGHPRPGTPLIQIRDKSYKGESLKNLLFGEALHYMPTVDENFRDLRNLYRQSLGPADFRILRLMHERDKIYSQEKGLPERSYDKFVEYSGLDAIMRGFLAPDAEAEWLNRHPYTPKQRSILNAIRAYMKGIDPK